jgi:hypothetical protein
MPISELRPRIYLEPWNAEFDSPNQIDEEPRELATIPDGEPFGFVLPRRPEPLALAFIDGIEQIEANLAQVVGDRIVAGLACAFAVGAVTIRPGERPQFEYLRPKRLVVWSAGATGNIPDVEGGWHWDEYTVPDTGVKAPRMEMVRQRRVAEAALAHELDNDGWWVVADGTDGQLYKARPNGKARHIVGCIKSHHVQLLPDEYARKLPDLKGGERTSVFRTPSNRYSVYLRLAERHPWQAPLSGVVRLEFAGNFGLDEVRQVADTFGALLPMYAGIPHVDPRAPQNLQPTGALERHLRRLLGDRSLARRAIADAVVGGQ